MSQIPYDDHVEQAALGCCFINQASVSTLAAQVNEGTFFVPANQHVFTAILAVHNEGKGLDETVVAAKLKSLGLEKDTGGFLYLSGLRRESVTAAMLPTYIEKLLELATEREGYKDAQPPKYSEWRAVQLFLARSAPIETVEKDWYEYRDGAWEPKSRHAFRPDALAVMPPLNRTEKRANEILSHVEGARQTSIESFRSFYTIDGDAVLVNVANGVLRISAGGVELEDHNISHRFTRKTAAAFQPGASCPKFERVLCESLPDEADQNLFKLICGNILLPDCRYEAAAVCYGVAGSGKSTLAEAIAATLGEQLVGRLTMGQLCEQKGYHLPNLRFVAMNLGTELDSLEVEDGGNFKKIVSGEDLAVRPIYGKPFTMRTPAKLFFLSNELPRFKNGSGGEQRRLKFLRFDNVPPVKDPDLKRALLAERDGILALMAASLCRLLKLGAIPTGGERSNAVVERFAIANDPVTAFVADRCRLDPGAHETKDAMQAAFAGFCAEEGLATALGDHFLKLLYNKFPSVRPAKIRDGVHRVPAINGIELL